jgi:hypothetical protein
VLLVPLSPGTDGDRPEAADSRRLAGHADGQDESSTTSDGRLTDGATSALLPGRLRRRLALGTERMRVHHRRQEGVNPVRLMARHCRSQSR